MFFIKPGSISVDDRVFFFFFNFFSIFSVLFGKIALNICMKSEEELDKLFRAENLLKQIKDLEEKIPENTATDDCLIDDIGDITEWIRENIGEEYL